MRRYNGDVRRCETTIASSPSHSRLRNSALSYLRPKGDSAKVEVAPSVHHPSLTFISQTLKHLTSRIHTLAFRICSGSSYTKNKSESRSHISLITCSNSYLTLNETELFTLVIYRSVGASFHSCPLSPIITDEFTFVNLSSQVAR